MRYFCAPFMYVIIQNLPAMRPDKVSESFFSVYCPKFNSVALLFPSLTGTWPCCAERCS